MIKAETKPIAGSANGKDTHVHVDIECRNAKQALFEYAQITANIRDMILANSPEPLTEEQVQSTVFSAFRTGMEKIAYSDKAAANIKKA